MSGSFRANVRDLTHLSAFFVFPATLNFYCVSWCLCGSGFVSGLSAGNCSYFGGTYGRDRSSDLSFSVKPGSSRASRHLTGRDSSVREILGTAGSAKRPQTTSCHLMMSSYVRGINAVYIEQRPCGRHQNNFENSFLLILV